MTVSSPPVCRNCQAPIPEGRSFCSKSCGRFAPRKEHVKIRALRMRARKVMTDRCQVCGGDGGARGLQEHDPEHGPHRLEKIVTVCDMCHRDLDWMDRREREQKLEDAQLKLRFKR